jgi:hypothetical protein
MANVPYKNITSIISSRQEDATFITIPGSYGLGYSALTYTLCDRTDLLSKEANYFISFRIPHTESSLSTGSTLSLQNPQIQQMNVDKMVISSIPREAYNEMIDGRSVTFTVPQLSGSSYMSGMTVVSSTYSELTKYQNSTLLGNNIAFLFADDINLPRTGTTTGGVSSFFPRTTWNVTPFVNRPQAHAYSDLQSVDINTDQRPWSGVNLAVQVQQNYPTTTNQGYNYDIPVGYVSLDKGFLVLTHPDIVDNIPWDQGLQLHTNVVNTGSTSATTNVYFNNTASKVTFNDISINFRTSVVCLALPTEFVFSTNPSWNLAFNIQELDNGTNGFDPVQVTEIGLYNKNDELIAVAKLDRPVEKSYTNLITFNLDIDV